MKSDRKNTPRKTSKDVRVNTGAKDSDVSPPFPDGIHPDDPLAQYWQKPVSLLTDIKMPSELSDNVIRERHRIFCLLLMALIYRFWNGNNNGPEGIYPQREKQKVLGQDATANSFSYIGDLFVSNDPQRISWDRYIGHNIACLAVDGKGHVMDFDFNHNNIFRSSAEHAESRLVRRLFSLADIMDDWKKGTAIRGKSPAFALKEVTVYTSLESCAQCSGVMSLGRVKQVVYLQNDPGAYRVGNIMYNLAGREQPGDGSALAALPIPASHLGLSYLGELNQKYDAFRRQMVQAQTTGNPKEAYFIPKPTPVNPNPIPVYTQSITAFLCTDTALEIFDRGAKEFRDLKLAHPNVKYPGNSEGWTNAECLEDAKRFLDYADVEGFRGSPHKL